MGHRPLGFRGGENGELLVAMKVRSALATGLAALLFCLCFLNVRAEQIPTRFAHVDNSPVQITSCLAETNAMGLHFSDDFNGSPFGFTSSTRINTQMSLVNTSGRAIRDVQFVFSAPGSDVWSGDLQAPIGVGFNVSTPMFQHVLATPFASQLACLVKFVEFADGNTWHNPAFK